MKTKTDWRYGIAVAALATFAAAMPGRLAAQQTASQAVQIGGSDLGGVVTSAKGPEAGVWVIAETTDFPTKFAKMVVTDDRGRYLIPDLPKAKYSVWVRGYGLVDSAKVPAEPGKTVDLTATPAPSPAAAAEYYPAVYWYSMLEIPDKSLFPGTGANGMSVALKSQGQWLDIVKTDGCFTCHQLGDKATRTLSPELGKFESSADAWERRIQSGQAGTNMTANIGKLDTQRALKLFGEWTDRVAAGELPKAQPPRPQGRRTQCRRHRVGLVDTEGVSARRDLDRSAQPDGQRPRQALRIARAQHRFRADPRSDEERGEPGQNAGPRRKHAQHRR